MTFKPVLFLLVSLLAQLLARQFGLEIDETMQQTIVDWLVNGGTVAAAIWLAHSEKKKRETGELQTRAVDVGKLRENSRGEL